MLTAYTVKDKIFQRTQVIHAAELTAQARWLDLSNPTESERGLVRQAYGQELQFLEELSEIEASARFYRDGHGLHLNLYFLNTGGEMSRNVSVAFTVNNGRLFTLHAEDVAEIRAYCAHANAHPDLADDALSIVHGIVQVRIGLLADVLERMHGDLEGLSRTIFSGEERMMPRVLENLAHIEDTNGKARLGMLDNQRAFRSLIASSEFAAHADVINDMLRDIESLMTHSNYLFEKAKFLMDSAMGMIDIAHNKRLNIFTILSVVLMPPMLVTGIYGMNFQFMPELNWELGYPLALAVMLAAAIGPILYLKSRDWL